MTTASDNFSLPFNPMEPVLTIGLILDALPDLEVLHMPKRSALRISWCQAYFDDPSRYPSPEADEENVLYFAEAANGLPALHAHRKSIIAVVDSRQGEFARRLATLNPALSDRLLLLRQPEEPFSLACIISLVQLRVQKVQGYQLALKALATKDDAIPDMLSLSEELFGNFMFVADGSYALMGCTRSIPPSSDLNIALVEQGYHDADTIDRARKLGIFGQWEKQHGVRVFEPNDIIPVPFMSYVMRHNGQYCGHVVMECNHEPPSLLQESLFELFALACNDVVIQLRQNSLQMQTSYHSYLNRLIEDPRCNQDFIDTQTAITGIPAEGCFRLISLDAEGTGLESQLPYLGSSLMRVFPTDYVFQYGQIVLVLLHEESFDAAEERTDMNALSQFCAANGCLAYCSDEFGRIRDIHLAFRQIQTIREHRLHADIWMRPVDNMAARRVFTFDDVFAFVCFAGGHDLEFMNFCVNHSALERLIPPRLAFENDDLRFLHCYLFNERRTTPTARQLGLHRNSIVYRANCLRDRYGIDLDRPAVRERLMECLKIKIATIPTFNDLLADAWNARE